jgi:two-component system, OmpR family, sensor kinase
VATGLAPVELAPIVGGRVDAWSALASERGVTLGERLVPDLVVRSTPGHLEQVLDNLIANAIDVAPPGTAVTVTADPHDELVQIAVADAGPGMTPEQRARAFDRFWRPTGADRDGGSGLGLAIVHQLVAADGGEVELAESPDHGLEARVRLRSG